jgi:hypothetical protein
MRCDPLLRFASCALVVFGACSKRPEVKTGARESPSAKALPGVETTLSDPCSLLSSQEIESVQGEPIKETKSGISSARGFVVRQCFFELPTPSNSISVIVTEKSDGKDSRDPRDFWRETFHRSEDSTEERDGDSRPGREEEREKTSAPEKIADLGDEAFWTGTTMINALYVLKGESFVRISVGGSGELATKRAKAIKLAAFLLQRFG